MWQHYLSYHDNPLFRHFTKSTISWYLSIVSILVNLLTITAALSSSSILILWFILELNLISFIGILLFYSSKYSKSVGVKYFSFQVNISVLLLFCLVVKDFRHNFLENLLLVVVAAKLGIAPFHIWFVSIMSKVEWSVFLWIAIPQKVIPLLLLSLSFPARAFSGLLMLAIFTSLAHRLIQTKIKKVMALSSVFSLNWVVLSSVNSKTLWVVFFIFYRVISISTIIIINRLVAVSQSSSLQVKAISLSTIVLIITLSGIPPRPMFFLKVSVLINLFSTGLTITGYFIIRASLIILYIYINICLNIITVAMRSNYHSIIINNQLYLISTIAVLIALITSTCLFLV